MQMKVLKVRYLESKKVLQNKCRLTRTVYIIYNYYILNQKKILLYNLKLHQCYITMCIFTINRTPSKIIFINPKTNRSSNITPLP